MFELSLTFYAENRLIIGESFSIKRDFQMVKKRKTVFRISLNYSKNTSGVVVKANQ